MTLDPLATHHLEAPLERAVAKPLQRLTPQGVRSAGSRARQDGRGRLGQAEVELAGARAVVHVFVMRVCFSAAAFAMASPVETQQAFLEGHQLAFT